MKLVKLASMILGGMMVMGMAASAFAADSQPTPEYVKKQLSKQPGAVFDIGEYNSAYAPFFTGHTYLAFLNREGVAIPNVTFVDGAHTFWHAHTSTCQILIGEAGHGYYQIWGEEPHKIEPGTVVNIPQGVKHWHGAAPGTTFQHLAIMEPGKPGTTDWYEPVDDEIFAKLK